MTRTKYKANSRYVLELSVLFFAIGLIFNGISCSGNGSGEDPYAKGEIDNGPVVLSRVAPPYTEEGRKARAEGIVVLQAIIRKDGSAGNFKVVKSLGYGLDESAIHTIESKWQFQPATYKGRNVDFPVDIEVEFNIY